MLSYIRKHFYEPSVLPVVGVVAVAFVGCAYYCTRLLTHPEVVYSRNKQRPWEHMEPTMEPRKFMLINRKKFEEVKASYPDRNY